MGPKLIQHDNLDREPRSPAAPVGDHSWSRLPRHVFDWRGLGVIAAFVLALILFAALRYDRGFFAWVQYGGGGWIVYVLIGAVVLAYLKWWLLVEQPGGYKVMWLQITDRRIGAAVDAQLIAEGMIKAQQFEARRVFAEARQLTLTGAINMDDDPIEEAEIIDLPNIGPLDVPEWMKRLNLEPHAIFAAKTKGGKSTMAKVGLQPRISAGESIFVIDPHSNGWLDLPGVGGGLNWQEVEDAMATVMALYKRRMDEREYHMRHTGRELSQSHFPRLTVIFDEANESRTEITKRHSTKSNPWPAFTEIMSSGARKVGISLWLICQSALIKNLGGSTVMRRNFTVFALDHMTIRELIEDEEPVKQRRDLIVSQLGGARFPAATVLDGQAFLLDRTNIDQMEPDSARGCAWDGWDYDARAGLVLPRRIAQSGAAVSASVQTRPNDRVAMAVPGVGAPQTDRQTPKMTPARKKALIAAMRKGGRTRKEARGILAQLGEGLDNDDWAEVA